MGRILISSLLFAVLSCGGSSKTTVGPTTTTTCTSASQLKPGHICSNGYVVAMLGGMCSTPGQNSTDCPPFYNYCNSNNRCVSQVTPGNSRIWFATDAVRPGVNVGDPVQTPAVPTGSGYIYNIMAKGYDSLDDWCMSQAQQSTIPGMKNISSWTALIIAQPDGSNLGQRGSNIANIYVNLENNINSQYTGPNQSGNFSVSNNIIYDKNGFPVVATQGYAWSGIDRSFCAPAITNYPVNGTNCDNCDHGFYNCNGLGGTGTCGIENCDNDPIFNGDFGHCECYVQFNTMTTGNLVYGTSAAINGNCWSGFAASDIASAMVPNGPQGDCAGNNGFDFVSDCNGGPSQYNANGSVQKPILCLANQS